MSEEKEKKLTLKQLAFCKYYVAMDGHGTKAAIAAGYSEKSAYAIAGENLNKPEIVLKIDKYTNQKLNAAEVTFEWKIEQLKTLIHNCATGEGVKDGMIHPSGLNGAISILNQMQGHNAVEKQITTNINVETDADSDDMADLIDAMRMPY